VATYSACLSVAMREQKDDLVGTKNPKAAQYLPPRVNFLNFPPLPREFAPGRSPTILCDKLQDKGEDADISERCLFLEVTNLQRLLPSLSKHEASVFRLAAGFYNDHDRKGGESSLSHAQPGTSTTCACPSCPRQLRVAAGESKKGLFSALLGRFRRGITRCRRRGQKRWRLLNLY
jgi:hypothetical protein